MTRHMAIRRSMYLGTWKAGINPRFHGMPIGASKDVCGVKSDSLEKFRAAILDGTIKLSTTANMLGGTQLPEAFDSAHLHVD